jgi:ABC-type uncharacterized transport system involved in gliding motility auxiliary subunit
MENKNGAKNFFKGKNFKYGSNAVILTVAVIAIAILANILVGMTNIKLDLTANKLFSLTDVTKNELKSLNQDVEIIGLYDDQKQTDSLIVCLFWFIVLSVKYDGVTVEKRN